MWNFSAPLSPCLAQKASAAKARLAGQPSFSEVGFRKPHYMRIRPTPARHPIQKALGLNDGCAQQPAVG